MKRRLALPLGLRTHLVALYALVYFIVCRKLDGRVSAAELACGFGLAALLQLGYLINKLYDGAEDAFNGEEDPFAGPGRNAWRLGLAAAFGCVCCALALLRPALLPVLVYSAAVAFAYSHPLVRLKRALLLKPLINTLNLFLVSIMSPVLLADSGAWHYAPQLLAGSYKLLLMVLCLTVLFDVRDLRGDALAGLRTLPSVFGRTPVLAAMIFLSLASGLADLAAGLYVSSAAQLAITAFALGALKERGRFYYDALVLAELFFLALMF